MVVLIGVLSSLLVVTPAQAQTLYGAGIDNTLYELNPATGAVARTIGPIGKPLSGLSVDPRDGTLYGVEAENFLTSGNDPRELLRINKATGAGTFASTLQPSPDNPGEIAFAPDGTLYGWLEPDRQDLASIDITTGSFTRRGESGLSITFSGLAFSSAGTLFLAGDADPLYTVNPTNSAPTAGPNMSSRGLGIASLAFDSGGTLFGLRERTEGTTTVIELVTIDLSTGAVAVKGAVPDTIGAITFDRPVATSQQQQSSGSGSQPAALPDMAAATVSGFRLATRAFRAARSGPSASAPVGTRVAYRLNEPAAARFTVQRARPGRRVRGRCVTPTRRNRRTRRCTRYVAMRGSFSHSGKAGSNSLRFRGRLRGHKLAVGSYRLAIVTTDRAGNRSKPKYTAFRIVRR